MNICGHLIKETHIVGIGPLMRKPVPSQTEYQLYNTYRLFFELHFSNYTTVIESDWYSRSGYEQNVLDADKHAAEKFTAQYNNTVRQIASHIGEIVNDTSRKDHINAVGIVYESFKDVLHTLFADLVPAEHAGPVNDRISTVYTKLREMRDLACAKAVLH